MFAYVGSRTSRERHARGLGISVFQFSPENGTFELIQIQGHLVNPSFLALNREGDLLYAVHGDQSEASVFRVDPVSGQLAGLNQASTSGKNPVHLALSPDERSLIVSNHITSSLAVLPIHSNGCLENAGQLIELKGKIGPHRVEQPFAKPHFNPFDPSGQFVLVPDKGLDKIFVFRFENGSLSPEPVFEATCREGSGPRNITFHPLENWCYCINELDSTVTAYHFHPDSGALQPFQILSSLSDRFTGNSRASSIAVSRNGKTLYASNRGEDSIAVFSIDALSGRLNLIQTQASAGKTPRFFTLSPCGQWLIVLNEDSDSIVSFPIAENGCLLPSKASLSSASPVCLVFR